MRLFLFLFLSLGTTAFAQEQPIVLKTNTATIHGSLLIPEKTEKPPVVLIIAGSGPTDRNGNQQQLENNSRKLLATGLQEKGIASLRFDKRGVGESTLEGVQRKDIVIGHFIDDVKALIGMLVKDGRFSKIIIAGHSEGAFLGMEAAIGNPDVNGYISIAGPSRPVDEMIKEQMAEQPEMIRAQVFPRLDSLKHGDTLTNVPQYLYALFNPAVQPFLISWMKYDPRVEIAKLKIPVLIIQGTTDVQVLPKDADNLKAAYPAATVKMIEQMNHVLKEFPTTDKRAQVPVYSNPDLPLHKDLVPLIAQFVKNIK